VGDNAFRAAAGTTGRQEAPLPRTTLVTGIGAASVRPRFFTSTFTRPSRRPGYGELVTSIVLFTAAAVLLGIVFGSALSRWQPAFPALFLVGVVVFLAWSVVAVWSDNGVDTVTALTGLFALLGWIAGIVGGIGFRRQKRRRGLRTRTQPQP
jgi:hypothetical protein